MNGHELGANSNAASNGPCTTMEFCVGTLFERIGIHAVCIAQTRKPNGLAAVGSGVTEALAQRDWDWQSTRSTLDVKHPSDFAQE